MDRMYSLNVYETPTHFYIIGSDPAGNRFRTLKIDRVSEREFIAGEPDHDYSKADVGELLATVSSSSIVTPTEKWSRRRNAGGNGLLRTVEKAFGIIGVIRFLEGYYLLLVSRAKPVAQIGFHTIYKIDDVSMIYLPAAGVPSQPDELKYSKLFQTVDFTTNFYFSYTYQLSRTLQENCLAESGLDWNQNAYRPVMAAETKFVWNDFLLQPLRRNKISRKWSLELVHGFIAHQRVELPCNKLDLILLARRSAEFAGTRFLKRGANPAGAVANDVETEQIVWDTGGPLCFRRGKFSSFVQRRGSVPLFWSQDSTHRGAPMVVGKPPILIERVEPHALTTAQHFRELRRKYGHPVTVLNLVKRSEHKHNENLLHDIFLKTVRYLNQFRLPGRRLDYISFDVSRCNKTGRVLQCLDQLGQRTVLTTGWFQNFPMLHSRQPSATLLSQQRSRGETIPAGLDEAIGRYQPQLTSDGQMLLQHGIVRANCVDCLDRTNVAQFGLGRAALGWQLFSMGLLHSPWALGLHTELCRHYEEMFDEHGDTLACQYAGSQLVHSIKTYKRTAVLQERSRDVLQTLSRYYSNTFSDFEKQDGINLFLGVFRVREGQPPIWSFGSDHYLHFPITLPRRSEFLRWSVSASSDNEDDDWLADREFRDWVMVKAREGQDIRVDNNWGHVDPENESADGNSRDDLFALAYRTFEFTSLEQLVRQGQQLQLRRPVALDSLEQGQQSNSFMWMFKQSEHSPSPPPSSTAPPRKGSNASSVVAQHQQQSQVVLSSLAAGTASIVRAGEKGGGSGKKQQQMAMAREMAMAAGMPVNEDDDDGEEADEEKVRDQRSVGDGGTLLLGMHASASEQQQQNHRHQQQMQLMVDGAHPNEAALAFAGEAAEEEEEEKSALAPGEEDADLLVIEDRNAPAERQKDPFVRFRALLDGPSPLKCRPQRRRPSSSSSASGITKEQQRLCLGTGLRSPRDVYFGPTAGPTLLSISDRDLALYEQYTLAATNVFERHNLRRQRRPTAWKLPNPLRNIRRPATPAASNNSSNSTPQSGSSTPILGRGKPRKSSGDLSAFNHSGSSTKHKRSHQQQIAEPKTPTKTTATASPFRKDFCRLGPVFEFRPPFFTVDSAFHTELSGQVPEESMRLYRQCVDAFWSSKASTINGGFNRARMADGIGTGNANAMN